MQYTEKNMDSNTKIIGFAGRKQAGKNTCCNFVIGVELCSLGIVRGSASITEQGQLRVSDLFGDERFAGILDLNRQNSYMEAFRNDNTDAYIKLYSLADLIKKNILIDILGCSYEQCYGSDEDKNSPTTVRWETLRGVTTKKPKSAKKIEGRIGTYWEEDENGLIYAEPGFLSARQVMQYVGTNVFRQMNPNVWVEALIRKIKKDAPEVALICDVRFENEVTGIQNSGGKVVKLTRVPFPDDTHSSETSLDEGNFDQSKFDAIIDNKNLDINQQNEQIYKTLRQWNAISEIKEE
jgi:hypothetical protein